MADRPVFLYAAVYGQIADAEADYEAVFDLHAMGAIGTFDSAVIRKEEDGKVRVTKAEKPTQHGAWTGAVVGALVGIIFPPAILGGAIVGVGAGGLTGHLTRGISRGDLKELGEELEAGSAAVIVLGESKIEEQLASDVRSVRLMTAIRDVRLGAGGGSDVNRSTESSCAWKRVRSPLLVWARDTVREQRSGLSAATRVESRRPATCR
jgi:uncharacterized membrane protein